MRYEPQIRGWDLIIPEQRISQPSRLSMYYSAATLNSSTFLKQPKTSGEYFTLQRPFKHDCILLNQLWVSLPLSSHQLLLPLFFD